VQEYIRAGYAWIADLDLEKFFDRVNHDVLLSRMRARVQDRRVVTLIHWFLKAGVFTRKAWRNRRWRERRRAAPCRRC
jgi:retron-type reverse transcriptase